MTKDGMLDEVYEEGFGLEFVNEYIAHVTEQISHRYPRMNIIEIGKYFRSPASPRFHLSILESQHYNRRWYQWLHEESSSPSGLGLLMLYLH